MSSHDPGEAVRGKTLQVVDLWHNPASTPFVCIVHSFPVVPKEKHIASVRPGKSPNRAKRLIDPGINPARRYINEMRGEGGNEPFKPQTVLDKAFRLLALSDVGENDLNGWFAIPHDTTSVDFDRNLGSIDLLILPFD